MSNLLKYYIDGAWVAPISTNEMPVINPADESVIGTILLATEEDVNLAVQAARTAFQTFSQTSKEERLALLENIGSNPIKVRVFPQG